MKVPNLKQLKKIKKKIKKTIDFLIKILYNNNVIKEKKQLIEWLKKKSKKLKKIVDNKKPLWYN